MTTSIGAAQFEAQRVETILTAIVGHARFCADLTAAALQAMGPVHADNVEAWKAMALPHAFLLELSAVLQIGYWEKHGMDKHIAAGLPSYRTAATMLANRAKRGVDEFARADTNTLAKKVLFFWLANYAWDAKHLLAAEVLLGSIEDDFIDLMAEFLFAHRNEMTNLLET